ncbi:hypothetical protein EDB80DRAFT_433060 [Ilyonectria destructans]|nr:hypothetical protein EDB80DRAFT_433060 [Ilyonectria destructans]
MSNNKLLRSINAGSVGPRNSMTRPPGSGQARENGEHRFRQAPEPTAKRQKRSPSSSTILSKFFGKKSSTELLHDFIEDDSEGGFNSESRVEHGESSRREIHDLTQDGSQADTIDLASTTSAGKQSASTGVVEYRMANPKSKTNRRALRKSRAGKTGVSSRDSDEARSSRDHLSPSAHQASNHMSHEQGQDTPLSHVSSDILAHSDQANRSQPATKRKRVPRSGGSEDELAHSETHMYESRTKKKTTNFTHMLNRRLKSRADIPPTVFMSTKSTAEGHKSQSSPPSLPDILVANAASGKFAYSSASQPDHKIMLHLGDSAATVINVAERVTLRLPWLEIQRSKVNKVFHAATHSPFVVIKRSAVDTLSPNLALEFGHKGDVVSLLAWLSQKSSETVQEKSVEELKKMFNKHFEESSDYERRAPPFTEARLQPSSPVERTQLKFRIPENPRDPFNPQSNRPLKKLKDNMQESIPDVSDIPGRENDVVSVVTRSQGPETRRTKRSSPLPLLDIAPNRWTEKNPDWDKNWHRSLVFPATGKDRATVDRDDISRLDEGEFLNDNLISFYFRYLQTRLQAERPDVLQKVHFFNTFFFAKLKPSRGKINYEGVKSWTAKVDLLSYDYIVVPVNENMHWYLAIIYNAPRMLADGQGKEVSVDLETINVDQVATGASLRTSPLEQDLEIAVLDSEGAKAAARSQSSIGTIDILPQSSATKSPNTGAVKNGKRKSAGGLQKFSSEEPKIITLDSLGSSHSVTCKHLKDYLVEEARHKKNAELAKVPGGMTAKKIPEQNNHCDCGVFILGYMEEFLKDPDGAVRKLLQKEEMGWDINPSEIRAKVRRLLFTLQHEQEDRLEAEKARKRQRKFAKESGSSGPSASQSGQSSPKEPPESSRTPQSKREITSPLANGIKSPAVAALQRVMSATRSPKTSTSPDKFPQPRSLIIDEDPKFVVPLDDDSSLDAKTSGSGEVLHSARESPQGASQVPVDLTTAEPDDATKGTPIKRSRPKFVERLSSSPSNAPSVSEPRAVKRDRSESPEITHVEKRRSQKSSSAQPRALTLSPKVLPSIESDKPAAHGPQYDGIDRSFDIASR